MKKPVGHRYRRRGVRLSSIGDCTVQTVDVPGNENPTYAMIPVDGGADALLLSGQDAADLITSVSLPYRCAGLQVFPRPPDVLRCP